MNYLDATEGRGSMLLKRRDDTHKMAEANKAFAHYPLVKLFNWIS